MRWSQESHCALFLFSVLSSFAHHAFGFWFLRQLSLLQTVLSLPCRRFSPGFTLLSPSVHIFICFPYAIFLASCLSSLFNYINYSNVLLSFPLPLPRHTFPHLSARGPARPLPAAAPDLGGLPAAFDNNVPVIQTARSAQISRRPMSHLGVLDPFGIHL